MREGRGRHVLTSTGRARCVGDDLNEVRYLAVLLVPG